MTLTIESDIARELLERPPQRDVPLSAEAAAAQYETAAKDIELMGADLIDRVRSCEALAMDALTVVGLLNDTAAKYREEARRVSRQIEAGSSMTAAVRQTCVEMQDRIAAPSTAAE